MIFDLDDRLLDLAKKLVFHESPEPETARRFDPGTTRKSLKPEERQAEKNANHAMATLKEDEKGPKPVSRTKQLIESPGSPGVDEQVWKRTEAAQASSSAPLSPEMVARFAKALGHDVSNIHVHTDGNANAICEAAGSDVVARGVDVFFRRGVALPGTPEGDALLSNAVEQLAVDSRDADDDQPLRRFVEKEESTKEPEPEPEESGWGLMGLVGAAMAAKQGYDALKGDKAKQETPAPATATSPEDVAKLAQSGEQPADKAAEKDPTALQSADKAPASDEAKGDAADLAKREQRLKEVVNAAEAQEAAKDQLPQNDATKDQAESLAQMSGTAAAMLDDVRQAKSDKQASGSERSEDEEQKDSLQEVSAELGLENPFEVAGDYEARFRRPEDESGGGDIDIAEHRLLMEVDVDDAATEFEKNVFGNDLGITVDRVVELVDAQLAEELSGVSGDEREQLREQIDAITPTLPDVIEQRVREAAESNTSEEQEELQLQLDEEQVTAEGEQAEQNDTFGFGARIDLRTGQVVVTTNDALPTSIDAAAPAAAPSTTSGDGGGGGGGGGGDGGGGGGGGAPA